jgi:hypothetical protein
LSGRPGKRYDSVRLGSDALNLTDGHVVIGRARSGAADERNQHRRASLTSAAMAANSLGLDFEKAQISDDKAPSASTPGASSGPATTGASTTTARTKKTPTKPAKLDKPAPTSADTAASPTSPVEGREKKPKPYVNPDRVNTGGTTRVCLAHGVIMQ